MTLPDPNELRKPAVDKTTERLTFAARMLRLILWWRKTEKGL